MASRGVAVKPSIDRRLFERALLVLLVASIVGFLGDKARDLRASAEVGSVQYSLGAMRVALSIAQVQASVHGKILEGATGNPFRLLANPQSNRIDEMSVADAERGALPRGWWFHDSVCRCIGYRPNDDRRLVIPSGGNLLIFSLQLDATQLAVGGGLLAAREPYLWWGESIH